MNSTQLLDYLINNDCELLLANQETDAILEVARDNGLVVDLDTVLAAYKLTELDPYYAKYVKPLAN